MCYSHAVLRVFTIWLTFSLAACSANSYRRVKADPISVKADEKGIVPAGIVEDGMRIETMPIFDKQTYAKIEAAIKSQGSISSTLEKIRDAVCDGTKVRSQPKLTIRLVLNKPVKGEALDIAAERNRLLINQTKTYLKQYWLDEGSRTDLTDKKFNSDFQDYQETMVETGMERKTASSRVCVGIPFIKGDTLQNVENHFRQSHATPNLKPLEEIFPDQWFPSRSFLSIALPGQNFVLSSKVSDFIIAEWGHESYGTEMREQITHDWQVEKSSTQSCYGPSEGFNYRNTSHFKPSANSWKLASGSPAHPLVLYYLDDLSLIKMGFAFQIPKDEIERIFGLTSPEHLKDFGYDYNSGKFSASVALENQAKAWSRVLANQVEITQTSQDDGNVLFHMAVRLDVMCRYGLPVSSLRATD